MAFTQNDTCLGNVVILYINCSTVSELKCKHEQQRAQLVCELQQFLKSETGFTHVNNLTVTHSAPNPVLFFSAAISNFLVLRVRAE